MTTRDWDLICPGYTVHSYPCVWRPSTPLIRPVFTVQSRYYGNRRSESLRNTPGRFPPSTGLQSESVFASVVVEALTATVTHLRLRVALTNRVEYPRHVLYEGGAEKVVGGKRRIEQRRFKFTRV